jgi:1-acyl-sn-glycerol-3-phosphate acyltransferase
MIRIFMRVYFRWRIYNQPRLEGGYVVVANHQSFLDPLVLGAATRESVVFLINRASYRSPLLGWFYRLYRTIPVDLRGNNRAALRESHAALDAGEVVGVFPEGGITRDGGLLLGNPGAVALVLRKNVSVVPVGLVGVRAALPYGSGFPRPRRIEVRFGDPIPAAELMGGEDRKARLAQATERIMREIARLSGQQSREDQLAGLSAD